ncbi:MAG: protein kinase [Myxococcota bacterium]|nr:protein kinase [Myxococcota bacterium]
MAGPNLDTSLVGRVIAGKLQLQTLLGQGSMGQVYKAQHTSLNKPIAIKVMRPEMNPTEEQLARFRAEAQASSRLDHPNTVQVLDFGEDGEDKLLYIAMEFLEGEELSRALKRDGAFDITRACLISRQILGALSAAHDSDIVHRDIKPGNIMLVSRTNDEGESQEWVKVCDFGIAKLLVAEEGVPPLTMEGVSLGTPAYAAPEKILGQAIDGRADLYATGVILYTMLAGKRPFEADNPMAMAMKHIKQPPPSLQSIRAELPEGLCAVVERAMAKKADERFSNAREMREALKPFASSARAAPAVSIPVSSPMLPPQITNTTPEPSRQSSADFMTMSVPTEEIVNSTSAASSDADDLLRAFLQDSSPAKPATQSKPPQPSSKESKIAASFASSPIVERSQQEQVAAKPAAQHTATKPGSPVIAQSQSPNEQPPNVGANQDSASGNQLMKWLGLVLLVSVCIIIAMLFLQS